MEASAPLPASFFERATPLVGRDLIGRTLCRRQPDGAVVRLRITETEAYDGPEDRACHAHRGRTARTEILYGPPGHWYLYLCYGIHWLANIVCGPEGYPAAVLLRGAGAYSGPGRLTRGLVVGKAQNKRLVAPESELWIEAGEAVPDERVASGPRVGIDYAGPEWVSKPWRWVVKPSSSGTRAC